MADNPKGTVSCKRCGWGGTSEVSVSTYLEPWGLDAACLCCGNLLHAADISEVRCSGAEYLAGVTAARALDETRAALLAARDKARALDALSAGLPLPERFEPDGPWVYLPPMPGREYLWFWRLGKERYARLARWAAEVERSFPTLEAALLAAAEAIR